MKRRLMGFGVRAGSILLALVVMFVAVLTPAVASAAPVDSASATVTARSR